MKEVQSLGFVIISLLFSAVSVAQKQTVSNAIYSGVPWFDNKGDIVSAHGGCILKDKGRYYFFGEKHSDTSNAFAGFNCYSSPDLYNWKFESIALPVQTNGKLGPNRVGERVKVMKCPKTGEYIMFMHADTLGYRDQFVGYATSKSVTGPYSFNGPILFNGSPIRKWDMGTFQDKDGSGYILIHGGEIYKLAEDYKMITEQVNKNMTSGFESPTMFRKDSLYYFIGSHLTSWERNDNYYYTAASLRGPWTQRGLLAPEGSLTWNSQSTFVLPVEGLTDTTYIFMGDRWSFPKQASAATYVWQPISISGYSISIPQFDDGWRIGRKTREVSELSTSTHNDKTKEIIYKGKWTKQTIDSVTTFRSDQKNASFSVPFTGRQIAFYGMSAPDGGYARVTITDQKGKIQISSIVDMYCKYPVPGLRFLSPVLPKGSYIFTVSVMSERGNWSDKRKSEYGSTGYFISIDKLLVHG